jgi:hypothetical protein
MHVNGNGILNNDNILQNSSIIEDVEDVVTTKANSMGEIDTKEEKLHFVYLQRRDMQAKVVRRTKK